MYLKVLEKHGAKLIMWLSKLKIAIIEKDINTLDLLMDDIPTLSDADDIEQAIYLLKEAVDLISNLKDSTSTSMKKMKKNIDFLKSTEHKISNRLDIKL